MTSKLNLEIIVQQSAQLFSISPSTGENVIKRTIHQQVCSNISLGLSNPNMVLASILIFDNSKIIRKICIMFTVVGTIFFGSWLQFWDCRLTVRADSTAHELITDHSVAVESQTNV